MNVLYKPSLGAPCQVTNILQAENWQKVDEFDRFPDKCVAHSSVAKGGGAGAIIPPIGLSIKMQKKEKYHVFSCFETVFLHWN